MLPHLYKILYQGSSVHNGHIGPLPVEAQM